MANYRSYNHLYRLGKPEVDGILNSDKLYLFSKVDGTNASIYADEEGNIHYGSRKREVSVAKDNAGFAAYMSTSPDVANLREFVVAHPNLIVYGEFLAGVDGMKMCGSLKSYIDGGFHVFDVFDIDRADYLPYDEYSALLDGVYDKVIPPLAVLNRPTEEEVDSYIDKCFYDLPEGVVGEGITIKAVPSFRDVYGNIQIAKIVREEFREQKGRKKASAVPGEIEQSIIDNYVTSADIEKSKAKVCITLGIDEFDTSDHRCVGMIINYVYDDLITEEAPEFLLKKGYKKATINFAELNRLCAVKVRETLGL